MVIMSDVDGIPSPISFSIQNLPKKNIYFKQYANQFIKCTTISQKKYLPITYRNHLEPLLSHVLNFLLYPSSPNDLPLRGQESN